jgi:hypothetical protein
VLARGAGLPSGCPCKADIYHRRCNCPKWVYIYDGAKAHRISAKTRTWVKAELLAQAERDLMDPVQRKLLQFEEERLRREKEAQKEMAARQAAEITIADAIDRWSRSEKDISSGTREAYAGSMRRIARWANGRGSPRCLARLLG